ncbi:MAG: hypothetical protein ACR2OB_00775 [Solirubrobacteraceae bacterium]
MSHSRQGTTDTAIDETYESPPRSLAGLAKAVSGGRTAMVCESPPLDGSARAAGFLDIRGWAYSRAGLDGVFVYLDGLRYQARLGVLRPDLYGLFGTDLTTSGFDLTIELDARQAGLLAVTVLARGADGHAVGVRGSVECVPEPELPVAFPAREDDAGPGGETFEASAPGAVERRSSHDLALRERVVSAEARASASAADASAARIESARRLRLLQRSEDARREVESSLSWRITKPLRLAKRTLEPVRRALRPVRTMLGPASRMRGFARRAAVQALSYFGRLARRSRI